MLPLNTLTLNQLGGFETGRALTNLPPYSATRAKGGYHDTKGSYIKRKGGEKFNTTALAADATGIFHFKTDSVNKVLIGSAANVYATNPETQVATFGAAIKSGLSASGNFSFAKAQDYAFFCNEQDGLFKTKDASTVTNAGIAAPGSAPTATPQTSGGSLADGTYVIRFTYVNDTDSDNVIESNPSASVTATISGGGGSGSIDLSSVANSADSQVTDKYIYMTRVGGADGTQTFNVAVGDNTTTTKTVTANSAGALLEFDHDTPPSGLKKLVYWRNRLFGFKGKVLYWSKEYQPWYWPQGALDETVKHFVTITNENITNELTFFDDLIITYEDDTWVITGTDELTFRADRVQSDERRGCMGKNAAHVVGNLLFMVGRNSVYLTDRVRVHDIGHSIQGLFDVNVPWDTQVNKAALSASVMTYDEEKGTLLAAVPTGSSTVADYTLAMDITSVRVESDQNKVRYVADWSEWPGFTTVASEIVRESGQDRWYRSDDNGFVFRQDVFDGDGSNITSTVTGATTTTITDTAQSLTTDLYIGIRITMLDGDLAGEESVITGNTGTVYTFSPAFSAAPGVGDTYTVGGIAYEYMHAWTDYGNPTLSKRWRYARPRLDTTGNFNVTAKFGFDFSEEGAIEQEVGLSSLALWDVAFWDVASWEGVDMSQPRIGIPWSKIHKWGQFGIENNAAGQPIRYNGCDMIFQMKGLR